jgi:hypothetical protein
MSHVEFNPDTPVPLGTAPQHDPGAVRLQSTASSGAAGDRASTTATEGTGALPSRFHRGEEERAVLRWSPVAASAGDFAFAPRTG